MFRSKSSRTFTVAFFALILGLVLPGCGDFCLFCDGGENGNGDGGGNGSGQSCERPFPGLDAYQIASSVTRIDTFSQRSGQDDTLSLAVVPGGMSFTYDNENGSAEPGDVLLADQQGTAIFVYEFPGPVRRTLLSGFTHVSGLALFHKQVDSASFDLLFFTDKRQNTLYIYDLTGRSVPVGLANPFPITNVLIGSAFFQSPAALAVGEVDDRVVLFILNDNGANSSVRRLSVDLGTWLPESPATVATSATSGLRLVDIGFFQPADTLFVSKKVEEEAGAASGWVYTIPQASTRGSAVNLDSARAFLESTLSVTGLAVALSNTTGTSMQLLVLQEGGGTEQVLQVDTVSGKVPFSLTLDSDFQFPRAIEYDCINRMLFLTDVPLNDELPRSFLGLEALPPE